MRLIITCSTILCCMFSIFQAHCQVPLFNKSWEKIYGSAGVEWFDRNNFLLSDTLGNFYLAVNSETNAVSGNKTDPNCSLNDSTSYNDIWMLKLDNNGNKIWERSIGGLSGERSRSSITNKKGGHLVMGASFSDSSCEKSANRHVNSLDCWVVKIESDSGIIWDKRLGNSIEDEFFCGDVAPDGSIILAGYSLAYYPAYDVTDTNVGFFEDYWVVKLDSLGNKIWDEKYGSTSTDFASSVIALSNHAYMIIGSSNGTKSGDMHDSSFSHILINNFRYDNWIIKIDSAGNKIWDKRYGCWTADDYHTGASLLNTDGDVVIGALLGEYSGPMGSYPCNDGVADTIARGIDDAWIYKIDTADGHIINERRFGGDKGEAIIQIKEMPDKGYIVALKSNSNAGFEKSENRIGFNQQNTNNYDIWLVRMDSAFNIIWDKTLGTDAYDWGPNVIPLDDSTFIVSAIIEKGNSFDVGLPMFDTVAFGTGWQRGDIWVSKWYIPNPAQLNELSLANFNLYPNPVKDILYITLQNAKNKSYHLHVQDMQGRMVVQRQLTITNSNTIMLESHDWQPGVYVVNIEGVSKKVVKL